MYQALEKRGLFAKPPDVTEHIAVARNTHDPFIYMDTFFRLFDQKIVCYQRSKVIPRRKFGLARISHKSQVHRGSE